MNWKAVGWFATALLTIVATAVSISAEGETPDHNVAKSFLRQYFSTAPQRPEVTWDRLTERYKQAQSADPGDPLTFDGYGSYFRGFEEIQATEIGPSDDNAGWWQATIHYDPRGPRRGGPSYQQFDLVCPWYTKYPLFDCTEENVQLNAAMFVERPETHLRA